MFYNIYTLLCTYLILVYGIFIQNPMLYMLRNFFNVLRFNLRFNNEGIVML